MALQRSPARTACSTQAGPLRPSSAPWRSVLGLVIRLYRQTDRTLVHVVAVRRGAGCNEHRRRDRAVSGDTEALTTRQCSRRGTDAGPWAIEEIRRRVNLRLVLGCRSRGRVHVILRQQHRRIRQQDRARVVRRLDRVRKHLLPTARGHCRLRGIHLRLQHRLIESAEATVAAHREQFAVRQDHRVAVMPRLEPTRERIPTGVRRISVRHSFPDTGASLVTPPATITTCRVVGPEASV